MDTSDLFASCRKGDVGRVRYLLEQRDVEVNVRDKWDSTPLYYACLCGHEELVRYLLANGARCEANTFDGERCLYGALSDAIRRALHEYKQVTASCRRRDYYDDFLQRLLEQGLHSDVVFVVHGKPFRAHRCVLGARSTYFANMLDTKWKGKNIVVLRHPLINPVAFGALLQYLYTGRLDVGVEHVSDCERLAKQCQLWDLLRDLEAKCEKVSEFVASKPGTCVKVLTIEPPPATPRLREDMAQLAHCALPPELRVSTHWWSRQTGPALGPVLVGPAARGTLGSYPSLSLTASTAALISASGWKVAAFSATRCRPLPLAPLAPCHSPGLTVWPQALAATPPLSPASPRPSSAAEATISRPCSMTTSERTRSWRHQAASQPSPSTASRLTSSPTSSTTSTATTRSCPQRWPMMC
ncbi:ankyrin repeat and BTB/POZ domain-containing protein 1 isoform X3 [Suricata suricatta]|uniref:ankyrin repeat and BTB/POZ domain-containing protein 1 isoform X3 n=1 Tax=Suricata suricatta TaxID=37032 RepID=UPI0011558B91|nr:ankyrin repeat and BTB/POZ domain-containing protein 1 isoform X3 [Suricata suricatta]